jgi:hypothetical protein
MPMKTLYARCALVACMPLLTGFTTKEESTTDCLGTIIQQNGEKIDIEHIKIGNRPDFEVYSTPLKLEKITVPKTDGERTEQKLKADPRGSMITLKPTQIHTIEVPDPNNTLIYQEKENSTPYKYLEILINGEPYVALKETKIQAVQKNNKTNRTIKLRALKKFSINECTVTPAPEKQNEKKRTTTP